MSPQRMIEKLMKERSEHPEMSKEEYRRLVCDYVNENDDTKFLFDKEGNQISILDYVWEKVNM